jgi:hypothetical protein
MTALCSHPDGPRERAGVSRSSSRERCDGRLGALLHDTIDRVMAAFAARADRPLEPVPHGNRAPVRFPQRPLILGDKWDF